MYRVERHGDWWRDDPISAAGPSGVISSSSSVTGYRTEMGATRVGGTGGVTKDALCEVFQRMLPEVLHRASYNAKISFEKRTDALGDHLHYEVHTGRLAEAWLRTLGRMSRHEVMIRLVCAGYDTDFESLGFEVYGVGGPGRVFGHEYIQEGKRIHEAKTKRLQEIRDADDWMAFILHADKGSIGALANVFGPLSEHDRETLRTHPVMAIAFLDIVLPRYGDAAKAAAAIHEKAGWLQKYVPIAANFTTKAPSGAATTMPVDPVPITSSSSAPPPSADSLYAAAVAVANEPKHFHVPAACAPAALPDSDGAPTDIQAIQCVVCFERQRATLLQPCRHLALCVRCYNTSVVAKPPHLCPICRAVVSSVVSIYM